MDNNITFNQIKRLSFKVYSPEEIKKISVLEINNVEILDGLNNPVPGGLYDLRLGPNERDDICATCGFDYLCCAGHAGHINLPVPIFNPVFYNQAYQLIRGSCFSCHQLLAPITAKHLALYQLKALDHGLVGAVHDLEETVVNLADADQNIQKRLERKFEELIGGASSSTEFSPVRSVIETRIHLVKKFIRVHMMNNSKKCPHCQTKPKKLTRYNLKIVYKDNLQVPIETLAKTGELVTKELTPLDAREHLRQLWENEKEFLQHLFKILFHSSHWDSPSIDVLFMTRILVPPSRFRRLNVLNGMKYADTQTLTYKDVLIDREALIKLQEIIYGAKDNSLEDEELVKKLPGKTDLEKFSNAYHMLQKHVFEIFDSDINKDKHKISKGIKQMLEKKEGLFRMNMMGKRVNYAARSVISPDPYINVDEIGLPLIFATKLTFPEPVNYFNSEILRKAILNGPDVHPGAKLIELEDGRKLRISPDDVSQRKALAKTLMTHCPSAKIIGAVKIVHRHVRNGDMLLINRQPTLHRPSIMAHKARILPGEKTLRLHYANCKAYNADFDGDEINAHLPQSLLGQAESRALVGVAHQYLVPKDGTPLSGLIQDHIVAAVSLTMRGRFFDRDQYHQLVYSAISFHRKRIKLLPPSILLPQRLWSGKQIISTVIINLTPDGKAPLTLEGKSKISSKNWKNASAREWAAGGDPLKGDAMSESEVIIRDGELLCGVIDKAHIGPTPYGMIHVAYELYGGETSCVMLTALARLLSHFLQYYSGFSLGIEDILENTKADRRRRRILKTASREGLLATAKALDVDDPNNKQELMLKYQNTHFNLNDSGLKALDREMKDVTHKLNNEINEACLPKGLIKKFPSNKLQLMIESGAKGASVNAMQISGLLGQIELEGRRMPLMLNGCTLPSFSPYDSSPAAGGFVSGRFLSGINPQEYFFHCMAGREGLIDTAVKTSRSGYLQRCLVKNLEGLSVHYDHTVRDSDGSIIQFLYGEDGIDPLKMQFLKEGRLNTLAMNYSSAVDEKEIAVFKENYGEDLSKLKKKIRKWKKKYSDAPKNRISNKVPANPSLKKEDRKPVPKCPEPVLSSHSPHVTFKSVSERMDALIEDYVSKNPQHIMWDIDNAEKKRQKKSISTEQFQDMCYYKTLRGLASPGEAVGMLAAQSIGEPSTQMTLNTFHFAGKGEMNVTLGIPRIREILMTASANIATPTMDLPLRMDLPGIEAKAEKLRLQLSPAALKDVFESVEINETISTPDSGQNCRFYAIRMNFLRHSVYKGFVNTTPAKILAYIEKTFIKLLIHALNKKRKMSSSMKIAEVIRESSSFLPSGKEEGDDEAEAPPEKIKEDEGASSEDENNDEDTTSAKSKRQHDQDHGYEDPEEEEVIPESDIESEPEPDLKRVKKEPVSDWEDASTEEHNFDFKKKIKTHSVSDVDKATRINTVKCLDTMIYSYDFDECKQLWCEITLQIKLDSVNLDMKSLLEEVMNKAQIQHVPNIKKAILIKDPKTDKLMIKTDGVNFLEIFKCADLLDLNKTYSNNIHEIAKIYGIEAATQAIRKEIVDVFAAYGITVDPRHLTLVADFMTASGQYRACNRLGMEGHASPLQQMTFETTKNFMVESMLMGVQDTMKSPSASIVVGQMPNYGTTSFSLRQKLSRSYRNTMCAP